ncbi:hypothetical protein PF008_g13073 [Phytophthora fragariae]|uniref:Malic enzyme NAD-binding domain-containing protein n=1 Tax=Phytophthora fragariae TaxID=53985 RepID=A0A6G0RL61_9STRA|nr:hypothetical protein PF008_g13073 [Phytophthora fragariae]
MKGGKMPPLTTKGFMCLLCIATDADIVHSAVFEQLSSRCLVIGGGGGGAADGR